MTKKATVKAVIMFFIVHLPSLPCRPCVEENEIPSEVYNVIDSEEGLRDPLVFNDPYWPMQWETGMIFRNRWFFGNVKKYYFRHILMQ